MTQAASYIVAHRRSDERAIAVVRVVIEGATGLPSAVHVAPHGPWPLSDDLASVVVDAVCASSFVPFTRARFEVQFPFRL